MLQRQTMSGRQVGFYEFFLGTALLLSSHQQLLQLWGQMRVRPRLLRFHLCLPMQLYSNVW